MNPFARFKTSSYWLLAPFGVLILIGFFYPLVLVLAAGIAMFALLFVAVGWLVWSFILHLKYQPGRAFILLVQLCLPFMGYMWFSGDATHDPRYDGPRGLFRWIIWSGLATLVLIACMLGSFAINEFPKPRRPKVGVQQPNPDFGVQQQNPNLGMPQPNPNIGIPRHAIPRPPIRRPVP
ncbi:MAG TPA: hypothetical protein VGJ26_05990 [Pirellulales bacterium]|jgi:hypothetical protein